MSSPVRIELMPLGEFLEVEPGTALQDILFSHGVEFPCGGRGRCKGCRVKVLSGSLPVTAADSHKLTQAELNQGWRLACSAQARSNLVLELAQWDAAILGDDSEFAFEPQDGLGVAVDLGTTTIVAQLLDLRTGHVLAVRAGLNAQARHGADIMSRVEFAVGEAGHATLRDLVRGQVGSVIQELLQDGSGGEIRATATRKPSQGEGSCSMPRGPVRNVVVVGNTVMHDLFSDVSVEPLSHFPFEPASPGLHSFSASELGWNLPDNPAVRFLPCLGGFVGSDILAGILATRLHETDDFTALIDLGTNGEIVVGNRHRILCASTAAGPAFEGARISMGMRAATGAISEVHVQDRKLLCHTVGNVAPRGICGSGLVDAVAGGLELGWIQPRGRLSCGASMPLAGNVMLTQWDIRELQLAKGAIAAGLKVLLAQWGATKEELRRVYLAGAFGNYINQTSAKRIGLLEFAGDQLNAAGNTALLGAKLALFNLHQHDGSYPEILARTQHVSLHEDPRFQEIYVEEMSFPETG